MTRSSRRPIERAEVERLLEIVGRFAERRVTVAGDFVADEYLDCTTSRISRESPAALVLKYNDRELRLGGGANAVANLSRLGGRVRPVGIIGDDDAGAELVRLMEAQGIPTGAVVLDAESRTVVKTRVMARSYHSSQQQVLRIDRESPVAESAALARRHAELLAAVVGRSDALLIADYGYGSASPGSVSEAVELARERGIPVTLDSRHRLLRYKGVSAARGP